jgi:hypothetical protein
MTPCNRRTFMTRFIVGTTALAAVGRVYAQTPATAGVASATGSSCGECAFYTATPGSAAGTCAFAGKTVSADDGCGAFVRQQKPAAD